MATTKPAPKLVNTKKAQEEAKAQAEQALIDARAEASRYNLTFTDFDSVEDIKEKIDAARAAGIVPSGEEPPAIKDKVSTLGKKREAVKVDEFNDVEIDTLEELHEHQESGKLHGFSGWKVEKKNPKTGEIEQVPAKNAEGEYCWVPGAKAIIRVAAAMLLLLTACLAGVAQADTDGTEESVLGNRRVKITSSGDLVPVTDSSIALGASGAEFTNLYVDAVTSTGDLTYQGSLLVGGRYAASSTIPSSSNGINPSTIPYSLLLKSIGNHATAETATLPNGTKNGQKLVIFVIGCGPAGSWVVTPTRGAGWTTATFNAKGDQLTLTWDSVIGWLIDGAESVTFTTANL